MLVRAPPATTICQRWSVPGAAPVGSTWSRIGGQSRGVLAGTSPLRRSRALANLGLQDLQLAALLGDLADVLEHVWMRHDHLAKVAGGQTQREALAAGAHVA